MKNATDISVVLDRSGSMQNLRSDVIGSFNRFVEDQQKENGECFLSLYQFDDQYDVVYEMVPIKNVEPLTDAAYQPGGRTALWDAFGRTILDTGRRLAALNEDDKPNKVLVVVITDGVENASKYYTGVKVKEMIEHQRDKYAWEFVYLAANQDACFEGGKLGISQSNTQSFIPTSVGFANAIRGLSENTKLYRTGNKKVGQFYA